MKSYVSKLCCVYDDVPLPNLIPATFVTVERWSAAVAFLMQRPEDNLPSSLSEPDQRLLASYQRVFMGRLSRKEANRLLGCLGWIQI
jgi:hypothetical protein